MNKQGTIEFINDPDKLAEGFLCDYIYDPDPDGQLEVGNNHYTLRYWRGVLYRYDAGCYVKLSTNEIKVLVKQFLHRMNEIAPDGEQVKPTTYLINNIILCIAGMDGVHIPEGREINTWEDSRESLYQTVSFNNGLLLFGRKNEDPVLLPHTPAYFTTVKLPYSFDPSAGCPFWEKFLLDVMDGDTGRVLLLQQWAGYLLINNLRQQKFLLIAGEGANGKNCFFEVIERMVGRENCTHIPLAQFGSPFVLATTIGKVANLSSESSSAIDAFGEAVLKNYTAGDAMSFQRKYLDPVEVIPTAKVMIATNHLPKWQDKSQGIWRRMLFVPFEKIIPEREQDKNLSEKLCKNLPGVFNWALQGMKSLKADGLFCSPVKCRNAIEEYKRSVNPARAFLQDNYETDVEADGLSCDDVYSAYKQWCSVNGYRPLNSANFGKEVRRTLPAIEKIRKGNRQCRINVYVGLQLKEDAEISKWDYQTDN